MGTLMSARGFSHAEPLAKVVGGWGDWPGGFVREVVPKGSRKYFDRSPR